MANELVEINEAINAGYNVLNKIDDVIDSLKSAKLWGVFDMFSDRSLLSSYLKHSKLDAAQQKMEELKYSINIFNSELDDVKVFSNVQKINFTELLKIIDIFFDNFFVDVYSFVKITDSKREVEKLKEEVNNVVNQLKSLNA